jgi:hypothetical protein
MGEPQGALAWPAEPRHTIYLRSDPNGPKWTVWVTVFCHPAGDVLEIKPLVT